MKPNVTIKIPNFYGKEVEISEATMYVAKDEKGQAFYKVEGRLTNQSAPSTKMLLHTKNRDKAFSKLIEVLLLLTEAQKQAIEQKNIPNLTTKKDLG